ncbi:MAG TPA: PilZ domain-containing protein [Phycisphaerae bacterium]|jgi:hypothetical protein
MSTAPLLEEIPTSVVPGPQERRVRAILHEAARRRAPLRLVSTGPSGSFALRGCLVRADSDALSAVLLGEGLRLGQTLCARQYDATLDLPQGAHGFATRILSLARTQEDWTARLMWPNTLRTTDRRRFWRARLKSSSRVQLEWEDGAAPSSCSGRLLNISVDGLACLLPGDAADGLRVAARVRVRFHLPQTPESFDMQAQVRAVTPGSQAGNVVCGLQFVQDAQHEHYRRLAEILHEGGPTA